MLLVPAKKQVPTACSNPVLIHIFQSVLPYSRSSGRLLSVRFFFWGGGYTASVHLYIEGVLWVTRILFFGGIAVIQWWGVPWYVEWGVDY